MVYSELNGCSGIAERVPLAIIQLEPQNMLAPVSLG
jgi:hypothetical protein